MFGRNRTDARRVIEEAVREGLVWREGPVDFDLRIDGFDPHVWDLPPFLTAPAPGHAGFHIAGDEEDTSLALAGLTVGDLSREAARHAEARGQIVLRRGDVLRAVRAEKARNPNLSELAHPADREALVLSLALDRGGELMPAGAIYLRRRGWLAPDPFSDRRTLAALADRAPPDADPERLARVRTLAGTVETLKARLEVALRATDSGAADAPGGLLDSQLWRLVELDELANLAARYGYEQAMLEASSTMEPLATRTLQRAEQARLAGRKNANPLRSEFIERFLAEKPNATNYAVARAYIDSGAEPDADQKSVERSVKLLRQRLSEG